MTTRFDIERALEFAHLPAASVSVLMWLCTRMDSGSTTIPPGHSPSLTRLARMTKLHRRTVMRHLILLESAGWVSRKRPELHLARTLHRTTHYSVMIPGSYQQAEKLGAGNPGSRDTEPRELGAESPKARGTVPHEPGKPDPYQSGELTEIARQELEKRTGKPISDEWAGRVAAQLAAEPDVRNPAGWIRHRISTAPDPGLFLPTPGPPPYIAPPRRPDD